MNFLTFSSALSLKVSNEAILPSLETATTFCKPTNAIVNTAATLLSIWLFRLILGSSWLFWDSFSGVRPPLLLDWYSISDWEYTEVGGHSSSFLLNCSLSCSTLMTVGNSLIKVLSDPKISLR